MIHEDHAATSSAVYVITHGAMNSSAPSTTWTPSP